MAKARILAVDDQRYFRELLESTLCEEDYDVRTSGSGQEALHMLEREDFDVVVTDLVMPGLDGSELVHRIRERRPEQAIVVVSGVVDVRTAVQAMKLGATDYILKPFDRELLLDALDKILDRRRLESLQARLMEENLEYMGVVSLFERALALFGTTSMEPLAERLVEGLCLETRAQSGVVWMLEDAGGASYRLVSARGLVRVDEEQEVHEGVSALLSADPGLQQARSATVRRKRDAATFESLWLPIREAGETVGAVRLGDKLNGEPFDDADRAKCEKFCDLAGAAVRNALRFRTLERRTLRDPDTRAYSKAFFEDAVRNEIRKGQRFGHRFSLLHVVFETLVTESGPQAVAAAAEEEERIRAGLVEVALRSTDLMAVHGPGRFAVLLPQTDALGAGILAQRIRRSVTLPDEEGVKPRRVRVSAATYPGDGGQLETLMRVAEGRSTQAKQSLVRQRPSLLAPQPIDSIFDQMLELGEVEPVALEGQILRFVLDDIARRPADRGVLFVAPGSRWAAEVVESLEELGESDHKTEIVLLAEGDASEPSAFFTRATQAGLDPRRPLLIYFGDGPAYAMVGQVTVAEASAPIFQTADRALVEHLAFELQRELGVGLSV